MIKTTKLITFDNLITITIIVVRQVKVTNDLLQQIDHLKNIPSGVDLLLSGYC